MVLQNARMLPKSPRRMLQEPLLLLSPLLNLLLNLGKLNFKFHVLAKLPYMQNDLITLLLYRKRKGGGGTSKNDTGITSTSLVTQSPGTATASPSTSLAIQAPVSPGPTTRRMAASVSTPTKVQGQ